MGKHYRENLKKRRLNPERFLPVVIDDSKIRNQHFKESAKILRQLDRLEKSIHDFHAQETSLFEDWFRLTFSKEQMLVELRQQQHQELEAFHYQINAIAELGDLSLQDAYVLALKEKQDYSMGDDIVRARINEERDRRYEQIQEIFKQKEKKRFESAYKKAGYNFEKISEDIQNLNEMTDEELKEVLEDFEKGSEIYHQVKMIDQHQDVSELLSRIRRLHPFNQSDDFLDECFQEENRPCYQPASNQVESTLELKTLYRQLVRKLHPDKTLDSREVWADKLWHNVQQAYQSSDIKTLRKIDRTISLRMKDLSRITVSEIRDSQVWLCDDKTALELTAKKLRRLPAWGFSKRKDTTKLALKIEQDFAKQTAKFDQEIKELEDAHSYLAIPLSYKEVKRRQRFKASRHRLWESTGF